MFGIVNNPTDKQTHKLLLVYDDSIGLILWLKVDKILYSQLVAAVHKDRGGKMMGEIFAEGKATREVTCNMMRIDITFRSTEAEASKANSRVIQDCDQFLMIMEEKGVPCEAFTLVDDKSKLTRPYHNSDDSAIQANRSISYIGEANFGLLNCIIDVIRSNDLQADYQVQYNYSNRNSLMDELKSEAFEDAENKASKIAQRYGKKAVLSKLRLEGDLDDWDEDDFWDDPDIEKQCSPKYRYNCFEKAISERLQKTGKTYSATVRTVWTIE